MALDLVRKFTGLLTFKAQSTASRTLSNTVEVYGPFKINTGHVYTIQSDSAMVVDGPLTVDGDIVMQAGATLRVR